MDWRWVRADGYNLSVGGIGADQHGDVYVSAAIFGGGAVPFGNTLLTPPSRGGVFLAKYDAAGEVRWAKWVATDSEHPMVYALAVDPQGQVYLAGTFKDRVAVGKFTLEGFGRSTFVAKFDPNGWVIWAQAIEDTASFSFDAYTEPRALALDAEGHVYLLDQFFGALTLGDTTIKAPTSSPDGFVGKFDPTGKPLWAMNAGSAFSMAVDPAGDFCLAGLVFRSTLIGGLPLRTNNDQYPAFIARCARDGRALWARQSVGGVSGQPLVAVDGRGNSMLVVEAYGEVGFGAETVQAGQAYVSGPVFARFDPMGHLLWTRGGAVGSVVGLISDPVGRLTLLGTFYGTAPFDHLSLTNALYHPAAYLAEMDEAGSFRSATIVSTGSDLSWRKLVLGSDQGRSLLGSLSGSATVVGLSISNVNWNVMLVAALAAPRPAGPPVITTQPRSEMAFRGESAAFAVAAEGAPLLLYQWQRDGADILGAANSTLVLTNVALERAGRYQVIIRNFEGAVVSETVELTVNQRSEEGFVVTVAGGDRPGFNDNLPALSRFHRPEGAAVDPDGTVYVADTGNHRIRKVDPSGRTRTVAGDGNAGFQDGPGKLARFNEPYGVWVNPSGQVWVADTGNHRIRRITAGSAPEVLTVAGDGNRGYKDGPASAAQFDFPNDLVVDAQGNILVCESNNHVVRRISPEGVVETWVGNGSPGYADGDRQSARLHNPAGLALDSAGNLYISEWGNQRIRKLHPNGTVTTLAGSGLPGFADGPAEAARFYNPDGLTVDPAGFVYVTEQGNHTVRRIAPDGAVLTLTGYGRGGFRDGPNASAQLHTPTGIGFQPEGMLSLVEAGNHRVRRITLGLAPHLVAQPVEQSVAPGDKLVLGVNAAGAAPVSYQWLFGGTELADATNSTLLIQATAPEHAGTYSVQVRNAYGAVESRPALVGLETAQPTAPAYLWGASIRRELYESSLAADPDGNGYLVGDGLLKFAPSGHQLWSALDSRGTVAVDGNGNTYTAGRRSGDFNWQEVLVKRDPGGTVLWEVEPVSGPVTADSAGNAYLGERWSKYDPTGRLLWAQAGSYNPIAADRLERIYALDRQYDLQYMYLNQFDSSGTLRWRKLFAAAAIRGSAMVAGMAVDSKNEVYITGSLSGSFNFGGKLLSSIGDRDFFLVKCDAAGQVVWARQSGVRDAMVSGIAAGADGVYVAGSLYPPGLFAGAPVLETSQFPDFSFFVAKYSLSGDLLWARNEGVGSMGGRLAVDSDENVLVTGRLGGPNPFGVEFIPDQWSSFPGPTFLLKLPGPLTGQRPVVWASPRSQILREGSTLTLEGLFNRGPALTFRWQRDGADLPAATNRTLIITNMDSESSGSYTLVAESPGGSGLTLAASVQVAPTNSFVTRRFPAFYASGRPLPVWLTVEPGTATSSYTIEESLPPGSHAAEISPGGAYDSLRGTVTFGPFSDAEPRQLSYEIVLPPALLGQIQLSGRVLQNGLTTLVLGPATAESAVFHPADLGNSVFSISWRELDTYAAAWRAGAAWPAVPVNIPIEYLTAAGKIWTLGGSYSTSRAVTNPPALWLGPEAPSYAAPGTVTLVLPDTFVPGEPFTLDLVLEPSPGVGCVAAETRLPPNWTATDISEWGEFDPRSGSVKWGLFFGDARRVLTCRVLPQALTAAAPAFTPLASFDGQRIPVLGQTSIPLPRQLTARVSANGLQLLFWSDPHQEFRVSASTDLITWQELSALTSTNGLYLLSEPLEPTTPTRFYRVMPIQAPP